MPAVAMDVPTREEYDRLAYEYMASLTMEDYVDLPLCSLQRTITTSSLAFVTAQRPDFHVYSEVMIQYPGPDGRNRQVVPDSMILIQDQPIQSEVSYNLVHEPSDGPFMVLEYLAKGEANQKKDYIVNRQRYQRELKVPYFLMFHPITKKFSFLHLDGNGAYVDVKPNRHGRFPVPEYDLEIAQVGDWLRFWYEGKLLPVAAEVLEQMDELGKKIEELKKNLDAERRQKQIEKRRADKAAREVEEQRKRAELESNRAEEEKRQKEIERQRAEEAIRKAEEAKRQAEEAKRQAEAELRKSALMAEKLRSLGFDPEVQ